MKVKKENSQKISKSKLQVNSPQKESNRAVKSEQLPHTLPPSKSSRKLFHIKNEPKI